MYEIIRVGLPLRKQDVNNSFLESLDYIKSGNGVGVITSDPFITNFEYLSAPYGYQLLYKTLSAKTVTDNSAKNPAQTITKPSTKPSPPPNEAPVPTCIALTTLQLLNTAGAIATPEALTTFPAVRLSTDTLTVLPLWTIGNTSVPVRGVLAAVSAEIFLSVIFIPYAETD